MGYKAQAAWCRMTTKMPRVTKSEQGIVAIFSVMIIMGLLTLIAVGFSVIARTAQRNTTDNQFSTQAFYAAESGVNDAARVLVDTPTLEKTDCLSMPTEFNYTYADEFNAGYTCVLIDGTVDDQRFDSVPVIGTGSPIVTPINTGATAIQHLEFEWDSLNGTDPAGTTAFVGNSPILPDRTTWGNRVGIVRVDLVPLTVGLNRDQLINGSYTFLLYPRTGGSGAGTVTNATTADKGSTIEGNCGVTGLRCRASVTLAGAPSGNYMMRIMSYYNPVTIVERAYDAGGVQLIQVGAQAIVDVTGKSNDVFRRIQVRLPVRAREFNEPFSILSADTLCKRLVSVPGTVRVEGVSIPYGSCDIDNN